MLNTLTTTEWAPDPIAPRRLSRSARRAGTGHSALNPPPAVRKLLAALMVGGSLTGTLLTAAPAFADPDQGGVIPESAPDQGGTTPDTQGGTDQGGTTPAPAPAPSYNPGPGAIPGPPQEAPYQPYTPPVTYTEPSYNTPNYSTPDYSTPGYSAPYNPTPSRPYTLPRPTAPVRPIAPPPKTLRVGNIIVEEDKLKRDAPWLSDRQRNSINAWAAYGESKIAQGLISVGVPEDEASRQAAATIIGVAVGGTTGAITVGVPAAVVGGVAGAGIGALAGLAVGSFPAPGPQTLPSVGAGAAIGGAVGAIGVGAAGAAIGAIGGGIAGGLLAHTLGAGDPGANPARPALPGEPDPNRKPSPQRPGTPAPQPKPLPNPGGNQFEFHVPAAQAGKAGLPGNGSVHYQVNVHGDVDAQASVGNQTVNANWSGQQAQAPYKALGNAAAQAQKTVTDVTRQATDQIEKVVPGAQALWPQEHKPAPAAKPAPTPAAQR